MMSIKVKPGDLHFVVSHAWRSMKVYDSEGQMLLKTDALTSGTGGGQSQVGGDTPFGDYEFTGEFVETAADDAYNWAIYGPVFLGLYDMQGQERNVGRAGIGMHGGRQGKYAYAGEGPHTLEPTHGCIRTLEEDLWGHLYPWVRRCLAAGHHAYVTVAA